MTLEKDLQELRIFTRELAKIYGPIASQIEELIEWLNDPQNVLDNDHEKLSEHLLNCLKSFGKNVNTQGKVVKRMPLQGAKKTALLNLINGQLVELRELELFLKLAQKRPQPVVIKKINLLYRQVKQTLEAEEAVLSR